MAWAKARSSEERLHTGLSAAGVVAVDEVRERIEGDVLCERGGQRAAPCAETPVEARQLVQGEAEGRTVQRVQRETERQPATVGDGLPENCDVGVVGSERSPVERLRSSPHNGGNRSGACEPRSSRDSGHENVILSTARRRNPQG